MFTRFCGSSVTSSAALSCSLHGRDLQVQQVFVPAGFRMSRYSVPRSGSSDGGGPADGDEGFTAVKSSSDTSSGSGVTID